MISAHPLKTSTQSAESIPNAPASFAGAPLDPEWFTGTTRRLIVFCAVLITATILVYQPAWNGKQLLDDHDHMVDTPEKRSLQGLSDLWFAPSTTRQYHPLLDTVYWLEDKVWGQSVLGYHLLTIALHAISAVLLLAILRRLRIPGGWLAAAIFALHPTHVESVAWMVELKNTLSGFFFFAAVLTYLQFDDKRSRKTYLLTLLFFTLGILVKAIVATLPAVMLLIFWWKRGRIEWQRDVRPLIPFLFVGAAAGIITAWMERALSGAEGEDFDFSVIDRALIAGRGFWFYLGKLFWPAGLTLFYPRWDVDSKIWWQYLFPLGVVIFFAIIWWFRQKHRWLLASVCFFTLLVTPLLGFFNVNFFRFSFVADHFQYLPSVGIIVPVGAGMALLMHRAANPTRIALGIFCMALLGTIATLTWRQAHFFRDAETCYRRVIEQNPTSWEAHINVGAELFKKGTLDEAEFHFHRVLELNPTHRPAAKRAYVSLGNVMLKRGKWKDAIGFIEKSLQVDPNYATAHTSLGSALHRMGRLTEALSHYEKSLRLRPKSASVHSNLAWMLATCADPHLRDGPRALALAEQANSLSGNASPKVLRSLAAAYAENSKFALAIEAAQRALELSRDQGETPFRHALHDEIGRYQMARPYHEVAEISD